MNNFTLITNLLFYIIINGVLLRFIHYHNRHRCSAIEERGVLMYKIKIIYINKIKGNIYLLRNIRLSFFYFLPDRISTLGLN